jgi:hypothetical protein
MYQRDSSVCTSCRSHTDTARCGRPPATAVPTTADDRRPTTASDRRPTTASDRTSDDGQRWPSDDAHANGDAGPTGGGLVRQRRRQRVGRGAPGLVGEPGAARSAPAAPDLDDHLNY